MILKFEAKIQDGYLEIGDWQRGDPEITNFRFLEKFDIKELKICISHNTSIKLQSKTITELTLQISGNMEDQVLNLKVDDLDLENLEVLDIQCNNLENHQLYNLTKFNKLHSLNVSRNKVDLTHIHSVISLTNLYIQQCDLKNIDQIALLTNLEVLNISWNYLKKIDSIHQLANLKELDISYNENLDIAPLQDLTSLIKLDLRRCALKQLSALKYLINLQTLYLSDNDKINITELQYLKNLSFLNLKGCNLVSIYVLRPLINLKNINISLNSIIYFDVNLNEMKNLEELRVNNNLVLDFLSIEKHQYFNNLDEWGNSYFDISDQAKPSKKQLRKASKMRCIEAPNIQLKEHQNKHKAFNTILNNFKKELNAAMILFQLIILFCQHLLWLNFSK
ncbi:leucine-rich_repeat domain-containing protein [Hexamita inflata]|uniref:Leucine-rich repeat domain-containing protein n=1 Tax=Hexamita inflata TaxID=28002 RepID=A0AA86PQ27_9EUKA|nr:leucine-rich repeat domain-containing protein [Hexamita inflata]